MSLSENLERMQFPLTIRKPAPKDFPWLGRYDRRRPLLRGKAYRTAKRIMDLALVSLASPIWLAAMGVIALLVLIDHPREPVIVSEMRAGRGGRRFKMYRFGGKAKHSTLPQLLNVLKGEMSLVGPMPTAYHADGRRLWHTTRLDVPPGLTGLWRIAWRGETREKDDERLRLDIAYIDRRCILLDTEVLLRTTGATLLKRHPA